MKGFGFSIKGLLLAVTLAAFALTALLNASANWVLVLNSLTALLLLTALIAVVYRTGPKRAFWVGFLVFCCGQLLLRSQWLEQRFPTLTTIADEKLYELVRRDVPVPADVLEATRNPDMRYSKRILEDNADGSPKVQYFQNLPHKAHLERASYCLWSWVLGLAGGLLARYFYIRREDPR